MGAEKITDTENFKRLVVLPIPDPLFDKIENLAKKEGISVAEMAERLLQFQLKGAV